jgi:NTE family protein/lysophospholipid hydrolase
MMVYVTDARFSDWTRLCLRQADRVLLVADAAGTSPARQGEIETRLFSDPGASELRGCELVLLHPVEGSLPGSSEDWLRGRVLRRHHHLRRGHPADLDRLCRHLLGRSVGLALGGGGARAFAEIGVLRALEEAGIAPDTIGGTSMGAVVGALAAMGLDSRQIHAILRTAIRRKPFSGIAVPLVALLSGRRLAAMMRELFGEIGVQDLWLRYFCVCCNLTRGTLHVAESGPLARWVLASNSVPGILPPVVLGSELFVDGGLLNNVPADLARERNAGPVIAVNVSGPAELAATLPQDTQRSGWRRLLRGDGVSIPRLPRILVRSMLLGSANHAASMHAHAALHLALELPGVDIADWQAIDTLVEAGYSQACRTLETWDRATT